MTRSGRIPGISLCLCLLAFPAQAFNPGTATRAGDTASHTGTQTICEGGSDAGDPCADSSECTSGTCTGIAGLTIAARGTLTLIADTVQASGADPTGWDEVAPSTPCSEPSPFTPSDCEGTDNSTLTLVLEFVRNGESYLFAETFKDLPNGFSVEPAGYAGWTQPAVESVIAERTASPGSFVNLRWGILPPAAEAAVGAVLGAGPGQRVFLMQVHSVPICTDTVACHHGPANPDFADHAGGSDPLATVRRFKVDLAVAGP